MNRILAPLPLTALFCASAFGTTAVTQVKLNTVAQPASGYAGVTLENLSGSGFPSGTIGTADVTVSLGLTCNGAAVVTATPSSVLALPGSARRISFALPATANAGNYQISVSGHTSTGASFASSNCSSLSVNAQNGFVTVTNGQITLNGQPFRWGGENTYQLMYSPHSEVDSALQVTVSNQFKVVRTWGWIDIGNQDGSNSIAGIQNGYYFQYWNGSAPAYNDGATGLENLDYEIYRAGQLGLKLIIPFTNNWTDFGGMDQYVKWAGDQYHDQFYTDPKIVGWYQDYVSHLLNRVNTFNGIAYKDDPTILAWELANEPRCTGSGTGSGGYPSSNSCTTQTLTSWVQESAAFIKSIDQNHLLSVGDEGFFCNPSASSWIDNCSQGVDSVAFAKVNGIDLMGFHLYPESWGQNTAWVNNYIAEHLSDGVSLGKPAYLGEFGLNAGNLRDATYYSWTEDVLHGHGAGAMFWDLAVGEPGAAAAENNNSLDIYDQAPILHTLRNYAQEIAANTDLSFAPVADDQWVTTPYNQALTFDPTPNDIAYAGAAIVPSTINLSPYTSGSQTSVHVYGGTFAVVAGGVQFTPDNNFNGNSQIPYTVQDSNGRVSNVAYLNVAVQPSESGSLLIESFETGTDNWGNGATDGTVSQSTQYASDGTHSLEVNMTSTGWIGVDFPAPLDLSNRPSISIDVYPTTGSGSIGIAFQSGTNWTWCQIPSWPTLTPNSWNTVSIPTAAASLTCYGGSPDLTQVKSFQVYLNAPGTYFLDNVRAAPAVQSGQVVPIETFQTGTDGWAAIHGTSYGTTSWSTAGSLQVDDTQGDWFGRNLPNAISLTGTSEIQWTIASPSSSTTTNIAIQSGSSWTWCQGNNWPSVSDTTQTTTVKFADFSCAVDLTQIHAIWIWGSPGTFSISNVQAQ